MSQLASVRGDARACREENNRLQGERAGLERRIEEERERLRGEKEEVEGKLREAQRHIKQLANSVAELEMRAGRA